jgi:hypothetical protein
LFSCVLTNPEREILYPFALVNSLWHYIGGRFVITQSVLLVLHVQVV